MALAGFQINHCLVSPDVSFQSRNLVPFSPAFDFVLLTPHPITAVFAATGFLSRLCRHQ